MPAKSRSPSLEDWDTSDGDKAPRDEIAVASQEAASSGDIPAAITEEQQLVEDLDERSPSCPTPYRPDDPRYVHFVFDDEVTDGGKYSLNFVQGHRAVITTGVLI